MIRDVFHSMGGIGIYGIVSTLLFVGVFLAVVVRVATMKRADIEDARRMPLDPDGGLPDQGELNDE